MARVLRQILSSRFVLLFLGLLIHLVIDPLPYLRNDFSHRLLLPRVVWGQQGVQQGNDGAFVMS